MAARENESADGSKDARQEVQNNFMPDPSSEQKEGEAAASKASSDFPAEREDENKK